ncbi:hypothetical protein OJ252_478 [Cryptosporidium canis]|uniref:Uncharacterized protein n=1 Tax=Cryptosporidium canis TaxID=195482 RepID=A0ABQ8PAR7_9CRYT|nr:hypothetical protein OJ252_478 [Cryptosporidium canis]
MDSKLSSSKEKVNSFESFLNIEQGDNGSIELTSSFELVGENVSSDIPKPGGLKVANGENSKNLDDSDAKNNNQITEVISDKLHDHFCKVNYLERVRFLISSNFAFECIKKLNILPPIRIYELWKSIPIEIREILFNAISIILINRVRIWSNVDLKQKDYFILWGCNYLSQIGNYLSVSESSTEKMVKIYYLNVDDENMQNFADIRPLKDSLAEYCNMELQPKVNVLFSEYNCNNSRLKNWRVTKNGMDAESFLLLRNNSAAEVVFREYEPDSKNHQRAISLNSGISSMLSNSSLIAPDRFDKNLRLFNSNNINNNNNSISKLSGANISSHRRRKTWHPGVSELEYLLDEKPPNSFLVIILSLLRLHAIDGILNSRSLSILQDVYLVLNTNNEYYKSSMLIFDSLQMLTFNDLRKNELKCDTGTLEKGWNKSLRYLKVAGATILGGAVLATATTIAAPGILAGLGTLGVAFPSIFGVAATAGTSAATMSAVAGVGGAGLSGWKMSRRESPLKVFNFHQVWKNTEKCGLLPILIGVSGWLRNNDDIFIPWRIAFSGVEWMETYTIEFEPDVLSKLGNSITITMSQDLAIFAGKAILLQTVVGTLTAALSWPITIMQYAATLDNTWAVSRQKTEQAAVILADVLCSIEATGSRPIKLVGYSMGARLIYLALQILHERKQFNKVQDVVLLGLPSSLNTKKWTKVRCVASNRLVNVFSRSDWVLAFFYRYMQWGLHVAGISPVNIAGVENYDVTGMITSHDQYPDKIRDILHYINFF